ncbi:hypothetical protein KVT40_008677 [Elsinoe batatas]|uniref:Uncharacterized protein n=1 Tax=Elsinoe batatas TaxID=2601811 RepID=A0A8K0PBR7_9PEZI|nr:hypothetical protein KVT40_008677 [Elsinoe batatas]
MADYEELIRAAQDLSAAHTKEYRDPAGIFTKKQWRAYKTIYQEWQEFADKAFDDKNPSKKDYRFLRCIPPVPLIKVFIQTMVTRHRGLVVEKVSLSWLRQLAERWRSLVLHLSDADIPLADWRGIRKVIMVLLLAPDGADQNSQFISQLPQTMGVSTKAREKPLADYPTIVTVLSFLWGRDKYRFPSDNTRTRLQLSFSLLLMLFCGIRPGEFAESTLHRGSNAGLHYRDFELTALANEDGTLH